MSPGTGVPGWVVEVERAAWKWPGSKALFLTRQPTKGTETLSLFPQWACVVQERNASDTFKKKALC